MLKDWEGGVGAGGPRDIFFLVCFSVVVTRYTLDVYEGGGVSL